MTPIRVVVLGGGFGGVYTALHLERLMTKGHPVGVSLVNRENYLVFQPMLAEVVAGDVGILDTLSPLRQLLPRTSLYVREIEGIDLERRVVTLGAGLTPRTRDLPFDDLVVALGGVTDFRGIPGLPEHALPFKTLADAVRIRNHVIHVLEQSSVERAPELRRMMLTFVVAGGGFSGTEVAAALNDFVRRAVRDYRSIPPSDVRIVLVHSGARVLERELTPRLSAYATRVIRDQGIELLLGERLVAATPGSAVLAGGRRIETRTLISTVPSSPNPVVERLGLPTERGRLVCDATLAVEGQERVWAVGDCAVVPMRDGGVCPPTAQHAIRQAKVLATNIINRRSGAPLERFAFSGLGKLGGLGHRKAVAELPGGIRMAGLPAWLMWRGIYWSKLPGASRKTRVAISWLSDVVLPPHPVQLNLGGGRGATQAHYEPGEHVFEEGDTGDSLFMILAGEVEVLKRFEADRVVVGTLGPGEYFGEMALLGRHPRSATVRARTVLDVLVLPGADFSALTGSLPEFRKGFEEIARLRAEANAARAEEGRAG
ncbi:MAG TPA: FAD-dependent oxidoreductase [Miltoncostaeaceae bacterium]|nr:FAD-dependent oxidoreductase [Miltoncostaeaceae bacterium]